MNKILERVVWSPEHGGCLMIQRYIDGGWRDWSSQDEGDYPINNADSKKAVRRANTWLKSAALYELAAKLERRASMLRCEADLLRKNA